MQQPGAAQSLSLPGPAGALEALLELPAGGVPGGVAVICHPHPLYGGTLHNKVVHTLARAALALDYCALRFNFRGVGRSAGVHDGGAGESGDALAAVAYLRHRWPGLPLLLAGFSFGGAVAIRAANAANPSLLVVVAPAVARGEAAAHLLPRCPCLIVLGEADDVVDPQQVRRWAAEHAPAASITGFPGVGHYFHGKLVELRTEVVAFARRAGKKKPGA